MCTGERGPLKWHKGPAVCTYTTLHWSGLDLKWQDAWKLADWADSRSTTHACMRLDPACRVQSASIVCTPASSRSTKLVHASARTIRMRSPSSHLRACFAATDDERVQVKHYSHFESQPSLPATSHHAVCSSHVHVQLLTRLCTAHKGTEVAVWLARSLRCLHHTAQALSPCHIANLALPQQGCRKRQPPFSGAICTLSVTPHPRT